MSKLFIFGLTLLLAASAIFCQANTCSPECGGNGTDHCTDYADNTTDPNNCKTCSAGNIGGAGGASASKGALCKKGTPAKGCAASVNSSDSTRCYLCSIGHYDPEQDPTVATPCVPCNEKCLTCAGPSENDCYLCNDGYFDAGSSPYQPGSCSKCDDRCTDCIRTATNCIGCCKLGYKRDDKGYCTAN